MLGWLKSDPVKVMTKEYSKVLEKAMFAQRNGDMKLYADLSFEAAELLKKIEALKEGKPKDE
jgi:hypothetical protein